MAPLPRSCVACKLSKTKCVNFAPGHRCERCERVGLRCIAAQSRTRQVSRAALGPAVRQFLIDDERNEQSGPSGGSGTGGSADRGSSSNSVVMLTDDRGSTSVSWMPSESCGSRIIFEAVRDSLLDKSLNGGFNVGIAILREWMAIARKRDAYGLMHTTIGISQLLGISLDAIVVSEDTPPHLDANGRVEMSPPIAAIVRASSGYTVTRTSHYGHMGFSCSQDFERDICSVEDIYCAWRQNKVQAFSIFVCEKDFDAIPALVGKLWRGVCGNHLPNLETSTATVRIRRRVRNTAADQAEEYESVPCLLKGAIYVEGDGRKVSLALMFEPKPFTSPSLKPLVAAGLPAGRLLVEAPSASALVLRKLEALYGVPQSALGTLPVGHVMHTAHSGAGSSAHAPGVYEPADAHILPRHDSLRERHFFWLSAASPAPSLGGAPAAAGGSISFAESLAWPCNELGPSYSSSSSCTECAPSGTARDELVDSMSVPSHTDMAAVTLNELGALLGLGAEDDGGEGMEDRIDKILEEVANQ